MEEVEGGGGGRSRRMRMRMRMRWRREGGRERGREGGRERASERARQTLSFSFSASLLANLRAIAPGQAQPSGTLVNPAGNTGQTSAVFVPAFVHEAKRRIDSAGVNAILFYCLD